MDSAQLKHRATYQEPYVAIDAHGDQVGAFRDVLTAWVAIEPLTGRELWLAQQVKSDVTTTITSRFFKRPRADGRWLFGDRIYQVLACIVKEEAGRWIEFLCKESPPPNPDDNTIPDTPDPTPDPEGDSFGSDFDGAFS